MSIGIPDCMQVEAAHPNDLTPNYEIDTNIYCAKHDFTTS